MKDKLIMYIKKFSVRRKMTELKERLKNTDKVLNDTLNILDRASMVRVFLNFQWKLTKSDFK